MPSNLRFARIPTIAVLALAALSLAAVTTADAANPVTRAVRTCAPPKGTGSELAYLPDGTGYFGAIKATGVSCAYGRKFIVAYWRCRTQSGKHPTGRCTQKVSGFRCTEKRSAIPTEIDAIVTCKRGGTQRIVHSYQQNIE